MVQGPPLPRAATARFSVTVSEANIRRPWGTRAIPSPTARFEGQPVMSRPLKSTCPTRGGVNPMMDRISVVFPMPLRPRIPTTWLGSTRRETPWRT